MDVVGSEIGQKMRSAIKAKLTELGCYVDDELPDYVMVMVANKRTRAQMEDDLQLFLGDNTELFVNWLHQVLKKLQEVTVTPLKAGEAEKNAERSKSKERKSKEKKEKEKSKKIELKKAKKKEKEKSQRKKEEKKAHKSKKKSKHHGMIRPNIPPLLMNIEKESEPSITDVFAGQILKSHGITIESLNEHNKIEEDNKIEIKPVLKDVKRPILPIIDPATISSQPEPESSVISSSELVDSQSSVVRSSLSSQGGKEDQIKEINEIEAKIQGLKQKLTEQLDSMSEDEDFLNIRTEAEELMNDFAEDVFQEISQPPPVDTPPVQPAKSPPPKESAPPPIPIDTNTIETLPQIELKLPKRPVRERLGTREQPKKLLEVTEKKTEEKAESPERFTPEPKPEYVMQSKSTRSRHTEPEKRISVSDDAGSEKSESSLKRLTSKVSVLDARARCASVVRVRPRPRGPAPASSLLLRAVADAHKSLLNIPPKVDLDSHKVKRALVLPMRRVGDPKIVIQVPADDRAQTDSPSDNLSLELDSEEEKRVFDEVVREEYVPSSIMMKIKNTEYVPSRSTRTASRRDDSLIIEAINIHNPTVDKDKNTQFIVTMDGYHPNAFLAKKLITEGLIDDGNEIKNKDTETSKSKDNESRKSQEKTLSDKSTEKPVEPQNTKTTNESVKSDTEIVVKQEKIDGCEKETKDKQSKKERSEKRKSDTEKVVEKTPPAKRRKASPIVFDVGKKKEREQVKERERTESASSDNHVIVNTAASSHKFDTLPPLSQAERKLVWCRAFPACRYGGACAFQHPRCKFAAACTRRNCVYSHAPTASPPAPPVISSQVVPAANYKSIAAAPVSMCKYYPACANAACPYFHPKPCRYGPACINKLECNFYHGRAPYAYPL